MFKKTKMGIVENISRDVYALQTKHERVMFKAKKENDVSIEIISIFDLKSQKYCNYNKYQTKYEDIKDCFLELIAN